MKSVMASAAGLALLDELSKRSEELEAGLAERPAHDTLAAQALQKIQAGDLGGAETLLQQSLKNNLQGAQEKSEAAAVDAYQLGSLRELQLDYGGAKAYYERAVELAPGNSRYLNNLGVLLSDLGEAAKAIEHYTRALEIDRTVQGEQHPDVARDYHNLGEAWRQLGEPAKAIEHYTRALEICVRVYGDSHPTTEWVRSNRDDTAKQLQSAVSPATGGSTGT